MEKLPFARPARKQGAADPHPPGRVTVEEATAPARGARDRTPARKTGVDDYPAWVRAVVRSTLTQTQKLVLLEVGTFDWVGIGAGCTAGSALLTGHVGCERKTLQRTVRELAALGLLQRTPRAKGKLQLPNVLRVLRGACLALADAPKRQICRGKKKRRKVGVVEPPGVGVGGPPGVGVGGPPEAFQHRSSPTFKPSDDVAVAGEVAMQEEPARPGARRAPRSGSPVPGGSEREDELQRLALAGDVLALKYLARRRGTATAHPGGDGAGSAPVAIASPATSSSAPETDTATADLRGADTPAGTVRPPIGDRAPSPAEPAPAPARSAVPDVPAGVDVPGPEKLAEGEVPAVPVRRRGRLVNPTSKRQRKVAAVKAAVPEAMRSSLERIAHGGHPLDARCVRLWTRALAPVQAARGDTGLRSAVLGYLLVVGSARPTPAGFTRYVADFSRIAA